uniref:Non-canonical purine NTP pyrophosphatase n=1 Tax=Lygus hesperus TaxID=30085 RepID=A0A0A9XNS8_LYGHE
MEETYSNVPVPQPRLKSASGKAPVPLPRTVIASSNEPKSTSTGSSKEDIDPNTTDVTPNHHTYSLTRAAKIKLRRVTSNVHERGTAVLETTRNVGSKLESSVRNMISKRLTTLGIPNDHIEPEKEPQDDFLKSQSLPAADIFNSISFGSPLASEDIYVPMGICENDDVQSLPPPSYPPPPLPDESIYDELVSARSGLSAHSSCSTPVLPMPPEVPPKMSSHYEEIPVMKNLSMITMMQDDSSEVSSLSGAMSLPEPRHERTDSCGSWKFYDVVHGVNKLKKQGPCYENVAVDDSFVESTENIYSGEPTRVKILPTGGEQSTTDVLMPKKVEAIKSDRMSEVSGSSGSKSSVTNELYENWKPTCEDEVDAEEPRPKMKHTKSVIYEFDPLFEERQRQRLKLQAQIEEELSQEVDFYNIPTPPERIDSLPESDSSSPGTSNNVEYLMYHRVAAGNSFFFDGDESQKDLPVAPKEGRKLTSLVRWTSMKRAIKTLTDGTPWSPGLSRKKFSC